MLRCTDITKEYTAAGSGSVEALRGVSLSFRKSEFVAILGPSGCGKTTLLNIIGGLDRYTAGDLAINGVSTREFRDRDWDAYRNHSVGFVFQTYNLIPHQSVLANVELALTLSGVGKAERRARATEALDRVGLADQLRKRPSQMSGGQMQRVAIARALVNDPEIVLADEPTGALDSETSVQIMELLKDVARDRLVVMVTHNPDLAERYATRTIRLLDGRVVDDSMPYPAEEERAEAHSAREAASLPSMSAATAFSLSLNNLMTKKARTLMIAFAGSIGIIGISLILSLSTGVQAYIDGIQSDALSSYPITIASQSVDTAGFLSALTDIGEEAHEPYEEGRIGTNTLMTQMYGAMRAEAKPNDIGALKEYLDASDEFGSLVSAAQYGYDGVFTAFNTGSLGRPTQVFPNTMYESVLGSAGALTMFSSSNAFSSFSASSAEYWQQLPGGEPLWETQYDLIAGSWPQSAEDVLLVADRTRRISDMALYAQGIKDQSTLAAQFVSMLSGGSAESENLTFTYDELLSLSFTALPTAFLYQRNGETGLYEDARADAAALEAALAEGTRLRVCGIVCSGDEAITSVPSGAILYTNALTERFLRTAAQSPVVLAQNESPDIDVTSGLLFSDASDEAFRAAFDASALPASQRMYLRTLSGERYEAAARKYAADLFSGETRASALTRIGAANEAEPDSLSIYPIHFEAKDRIIALIDAYNESARAQNEEERVIRYTDYVGILMSSVSTIVNAVTYALVAFVAISLVVSSIMIGVITYISVLERTKEIGVLRSIGASRGDISRVFNAETLIVGLAAGALGVAIAWLITIPANAIVRDLSGIAAIAKLPARGAGALVAVSMLLTVIAGLVPSRIAAKRDPVVALRSE